MWKLRLIGKEKEQEYKNLILKEIGVGVPKETEYLLTAAPNELRDNKQALQKKYFSEKEYSNYKKGIRLEKKKRTKQQIKAIKKHVYLTKKFNYEKLISSNKVLSYKIAELIGVKTCVYCNRQYIFTITDNGKNICRPDFDHYYPKSKYPFFALSLYNLIPSCHICNSNCKCDKELPECMNPYENHSKNEFFKFSYVPNAQGYPKEILIKDIAPEYREDVKKFIETMKIKEIYDSHVELELKEMYEFATKYSNTYLRELLCNIKLDMRLSQEEAYKMLFGTELFRDKDNNRPLSKFKRDILKDLNVID